MIWLGVQDHVSEILAISDIYVQPSRSEGISLSLMEASVQALPLIATNIGGMPEVVENNFNGYLVADAAQMSIALNKLCRDSNLRESMGRRARTKALDLFDICKSAYRYTLLYKS